MCILHVVVNDSGIIELDIFDCQNNYEFFNIF